MIILPDRLCGIHNAAARDDRDPKGAPLPPGVLAYSAGSASFAAQADADVFFPVPALRCDGYDAQGRVAAVVTLFDVSAANRAAIRTVDDVPVLSFSTRREAQDHVNAANRVAIALHQFDREHGDLAQVLRWETQNLQPPAFTAAQRRPYLPTL